MQTKLLLLLLLSGLSSTQCCSNRIRLNLTAVRFSIKSSWDSVRVCASTLTAAMAAVANWTARDTSPDWINLVNSLLSPVVRFVAMSTKFAASRSGSRTYYQVENNSNSIQLILNNIDAFNV